MKKIYSLLFMLCACTMANAQQFGLEFCGEPVADGATVEVYASMVNLEEDPAEEPWWIVEFSEAKGLKIDNYTNDDVLINATATTDNTKKLQWCMGGFCEMFNGNTMSKSEAIVPLGEIELQLEPGTQTEGDYGVWNVNLTLSSATETHTYTIKYIYVEPQFSLEFNGNRIGGGETVEVYATMKNLEEDPAEEPWWVVEFDEPAKGLKIANYTEDDLLINATAWTDNTKMLQWCMGGFCEMFSVSTMKKSEEIVPFGAIELQLEPGMQNEGEYDEWNVMLTLSSAAETHHYYLKYIYDETAGVGTVLAPAGDGAIFNLAGKRVTAAERGICIVGGKKVIR